jgi:hypothetical protein
VLSDDKSHSTKHPDGSDKLTREEWLRELECGELIYLTPPMARELAGYLRATLSAEVQPTSDDLKEYGDLAWNDAIDSAMETADGIIDPELDGLRVVMREALRKLKKSAPNAVEEPRRHVPMVEALAAMDALQTDPKVLEMLKAAPSHVGATDGDVVWLHRFINCAVFGPPASECQRAHRIVEALTATPSSTRALEDFIEELSAYAEKGDCDACRGAGCVGIPGAQCRYCDGSGKNRLALAFKWLALEKRVNVAEEIAQRQMNDAEAARLELAELRSRTLSARKDT